VDLVTGVCFLLTYEDTQEYRIFTIGANILSAVINVHSKVN